MPSASRHAVRRGARELWSTLLDAVLSPRCAACAGDVGSGSLCAGCAHLLERRQAPACARCGEPLARVGARCRADHRALANLALARAPLRYRGTGARLVHRLKFQRDLVAGRFLVRGMVLRMRDWAGADGRRALVVPVPRHKSKARQAGFDPAMWLAEGVAAGLRLELAADALERTRPTLPQADPRVTSREQNVAGAFRCRRAYAVVGHPVLLVDDVLTSGATARACARVLLAAGARKVAALTAARA